jgi:hypothetical protein
MSNQKKLTKPMTQSRNLDNNTAQHISYQELIISVIHKFFRQTLGLYLIGMMFGYGFSVGFLNLFIAIIFSAPKYFVADASDSDTRYGFLLGAGASVESGIPVAKELSEGWLKTIKNNKGANDNDADLKKWEEEPAKYYGEIFSRRFRANLSAGHKELQQYINRETPSIGYLFLAQIDGFSTGGFS